ncbi:HEPN domain-containing protein [Azospirillum sp. sgz302134]
MDAEALSAWIVVADRDIKGIRNNLFGPEPEVGVAAYHCQQAAEKLVKAVLLSMGTNPPRIHDIDALIDRIPVENPLLPILRPLGRFTEFVAALRYPGPGPFDDPPDEPSLDEVSSWLAEIVAVRAEVVRYLDLAM